MEMALRSTSTMSALLLLLSFLTMVSAWGRKVTDPNRVPKNAVLLSEVTSLTLRAGKQTQSRRVSPVPQLTCVGPDDVCALYNVDVMRCTNEGADYDAENIQWSCKASLPVEFKLGSTEVGCEGYESSEDPYVLKGSCGVEYRLLLTNEGEEKFGHGLHDSHPGDSSNTSDFSSVAFVIIFAVVLFIIVRGIYTASRNNPPRLGGHLGRGWGGNNDDDDPPPPYDDTPRSPPRQTNSRPKSSTARSKTSSQSSSSQTGTQAQTSQGTSGLQDPRFWTGAATGAAGAYMYNRMTQTDRQAPRAEPQPQRSSWSFTAGNGQSAPPAAPAPQGASWFSSPSAGSNSQQQSQTSQSSRSNFSTSRHESTGFGGTSRR